MDSAADVAARLRATGYLADEELATVVFLASRMQRPLLLEGEPWTGKTALAEALAQSLGLPLVRGVAADIDLSPQRQEGPFAGGQQQ